MTTEPLIRDATAEDDVAVGELLVRAFVDTYARKMPEVVVTEERKGELRAVAEKRRVAHVWVAELNGKVVGTVALWPPGSSRSEAWIKGAADLRHLAVDRNARGLGISRMLIETAEHKAWSLGAPFVCLHVRRGAHGVRELYEATGYVRDDKGDLDYPSVFLEAFYKPKPTLKP